MPTKRRRRKRSLPYTTGELNAIADDIFHPLIREHKELRIIDELAHVAIEGDLKVSLIKFIKYTLPQIVRKLLSDESE